MAFSREALDFLAENRLRDSRDWFKAHKGDYERLVLAPMQELVVRLTPVMRAIDPQLICEPRVGRSISRIYRDTRFSRDKSIYRANVWCIFIRDKQLWEGPPAFYADISPAGYSYGCGYYQASAASMAIIREMVLAGDRTFRAAAAALRAQPAFALEGERYKRSKYPERPAEERDWLDRKSIGASAAGSDLGLLCSDRFAEQAARDLAGLAPFYRFLMIVESRRPRPEQAEGFAPDPFCGR